jgi:hypothetical protein
MNMIIMIWKRLLWIWGIIIFFTIICISPRIQSYLHLPTIRAIWIVGWGMIPSMITILYGALLQWNKSFESIAISTIIWSVTRITSWSLLVYLWYWLYGAIGGVIIASRSLLIYQRYQSKQYITPTIDSSWNDYYTTQKSIYSDFKKELPSLSMFVGASISIILLSNMDIIIAQHLFPGTIAGYYVAVSIVAKFLVFLWWAIETVYYPIFVSTDLKNISLIQIRNYVILSSVLILWALWWTYLLWWHILELFKPWLWIHWDLLLRLIVASWGIFFSSTCIKLLVARKQHVVSLVCLGSIVSLYILLNTADSIDIFISYVVYGIWTITIWSFLLLVYAFYNDNRTPIS